MLANTGSQAEQPITLRPIMIRLAQRAEVQDYFDI